MQQFLEAQPQQFWEVYAIDPGAGGKGVSVKGCTTSNKAAIRMENAAFPAKKNFTEFYSYPGYARGQNRTFKSVPPPLSDFMEKLFCP